ncbi:9300_t:CDS:2 [Cetraspora pellucida]|uniref:9300_t:CDS:1 n=1 Tax=Cetraspora pellucida TaxID=1433469 RepID=A0A9N9CUC2_9GLOM|nr:9300_t:CDS:2 [Cetraspora pellucida]
MDQKIIETSLRHVKNNSLPNHPSPQTVLSEHEEQQLVGYYKNIQKLGFGLTRTGLNYCVMSIVNADNRSYPFKNNHPDLSFHVSQALSEAYAQKANSIIVKDHFDKFQKIIQENSLTAKRIWNINETEFVISPKVQKVLATKGFCQVHKVAHSNFHKHISVAPMISAASGYIPSLLIYKGIRAIPDLLNGASVGTVMGFTDLGYMHESLFQMYIEHFINSIPPSWSILLILDEHKSHPSELPFAKLKAKYDKGCDKLHSETSKLVTKYTFAKMLRPVFIKTYTSKAITNAYRVTGIWPFNPNAINPDCFSPSLSTKRIINSSSFARVEKINNLSSFAQVEQEPSAQLEQEPSTQVEQEPSTQVEQELSAQVEQELSLPNTISFSQLNNHSNILFHSNNSAWVSIVSINELLAEINSLKKENKTIKRSYQSTQEKLKTFKNSGTCLLKMSLKYPSSRVPIQVKSESVQPKKRKNFLFARLLTNEESLQQLKEMNESAKKKLENVKQKKKVAAQKQANQEAKKAQKKLN